MLIVTRSSNDFACWLCATAPWPLRRLLGEGGGNEGGDDAPAAFDGICEGIRSRSLDPPLCPDPHTADKKDLIANFRTDSSIPVRSDRPPLEPIQRSDSIGS